MQIPPLPPPAAPDLQVLPPIKSTPRHGPRLNAYRCEVCDHIIVTVDVAVGVTPFMLRCLTGTCKGSMQSNMYPNGIPLMLATFEWYQGKNECLDLRPRSSAEPALHGETEGAFAARVGTMLHEALASALVRDPRVRRRVKTSMRSHLLRRRNLGG